MSANSLALVIATWFGCGYFPVGPGTAGSVAALLIAFALHRYAGWQPWYFAALACALLPVSIWAATRTARHSGRKDPSIVVVDEVIGQWITLAGAASLNGFTWAAAFALFRVFDIVKPPPVRQLERLPDGAGIIADDVMAGIYAALVLLLFRML